MVKFLLLLSSHASISGVPRRPHWSERFAAGQGQVALYFALKRLLALSDSTAYDGHRMVMLEHTLAGGKHSPASPGHPQKQLCIGKASTP